MSDWETCIRHNATGYELQCSKCGKETPLARPHKALIVACQYCGVIHSRDHFEAYRKIVNSIRKDPASRLIPLLAKGTLGERHYTVIGIAIKSEKNNIYGKWTEYVLLDDLGNTHFLNCSYGHYTLLTEDIMLPCESITSTLQDDFVFEGHKYRFFSTYHYETLSCVGEFHYDVVDVEKIKCFDFISPPFAISIEKTDLHSYSGFSGRHLTRKQVAEMFGNWRIESQEHEGAGMAQPFYGGLNVKKLNRLSLIFLSAFVTVVLLFALFAPVEKKLFYLHKELPSQQTEQEFVSKTFRLTDDHYRYFLHFRSYTNLNNEWVESQVTLINETTGEERDCSFGAEYYSGIEDGYHWSEGSDDASVNLSSVPSGKYHLKLKVFRPYSLNDLPYTFEASVDSPLMWNFGIVFFPYIVLLVILNLLNYQFERMRKGDIDSLFGSS